MSSASWAGRLADRDHVGDQRRRDAAVGANLDAGAQLGIAPDEDGDLVRRADQVALADLVGGADEARGRKAVAGVGRPLAQPDSATALTVAAKALPQDLADTRMIDPLHLLPSAPPVPVWDARRAQNLAAAMAARGKITVRNKALLEPVPERDRALKRLIAPRRPPFRAPPAGRGRPAGLPTGHRRRPGRPRRGRRGRRAGISDVVRQPVERRAQAADDRRPPPRRAAEAVGDRDRIIAANDLAEIARRGELVVHAAVGDQEGLAVARLAIEDPGQIDPGLADQPATELDRKFRIFKNLMRGALACAERAPTALDVERLLAVEIGNAEAAAEIDERRRRAGLVGKARAASASVAPCASISALGVERLRTGENVEAAPLGAGFDDPADQGGTRAPHRRRTAWRRRPCASRSP